MAAVAWPVHSRHYVAAGTGSLNVLSLAAVQAISESMLCRCRRCHSLCPTCGTRQPDALQWQADQTDDTRVDSPTDHDCVHCLFSRNLVSYDTCNLYLVSHKIKPSSKLK